MTSRCFALLVVGALMAQAQVSPNPSPRPDNKCLEALASTGCLLLWEVDASAATSSGSQTSPSTAPNLMFKLDYQVASPKDPMIVRSIGTRNASHQSMGERFAAHLIFDTGYTQVPVSTKVAPVSGFGSAGSTGPTSCPGAAAPAATPPASCTIVAPQQAFVVDAAARIGWTFGRNGQGAYSEIGIAGRGALDDVIPVNQLLQSGGYSFADLASANSRSPVGLYEGTFHFRVGQLGHDTPADSTGKYANVSDLLVIEAGYQVDTGLAQLDPMNPQANTRKRLVGRFYAYPELPGATHTKILVGLEYSGGIGGGPQVIQLFWGTNLNLAKLFSTSQ